MARYTTKPDRPADTAWSWVGHDFGDAPAPEVYDDPSWSEDQPTGILDAEGRMIYRAHRRIGFGAE